MEAMKPERGQQNPILSIYTLKSHRMANINGPWTEDLMWGWEGEVLTGAAAGKGGERSQRVRLSQEEAKEPCVT